jgi:hypothetical protein
MKITIELTDQEHATLTTLAKRCAEIGADGATSHGPLTVEGLLSMLAEDCALVVTRPGSREAVNMARVLASHGYDLT